MSKNDWTVLFVRVVGLYLVATHLATFAITAASLIITLMQTKGAGLTTANLYVWQGPFVSTLALIIGLLLIFQAGPIAAAIQRNDPKNH